MTHNTLFTNKNENIKIIKKRKIFVIFIIVFIKKKKKLILNIYKNQDRKIVNIKTC